MVDMADDATPAQAPEELPVPDPLVAKRAAWSAPHCDEAPHDVAPGARSLINASVRGRVIE